MCMKNINISTDFYESDLSEFNGNVRFGRAIETLKAVKKDDKYVIEKLTVATYVAAMSCTEDKELSKKYSICWTFGKIDGDKFSSYKIAEDEINPYKNRKEKVSNAICRHFYNQTFKFTLNNYELENCTEDAEDYYLKVFIKTNDETVWTLQSMNYIKIEF